MINKLYSLFGEIFENAQYIEWNILIRFSDLNAALSHVCRNNF